jgi:hypothetical protein
MSLKVLEYAALEICSLWDVSPRNPLRVNWRFGAACHLNILGRGISQTRVWHEPDRNFSFLSWGWKLQGLQLSFDCQRHVLCWIWYFSETQLWEILGFHGGDSEECRLLGYKSPVRTSQEIQYFSARETSQLMLFKIWGIHGGDYEECHLLWYYAVWLLQEPTFQRNVSPPSSVWQEQR